MNSFSCSQRANERQEPVDTNSLAWAYMGVNACRFVNHYKIRAPTGILEPYDRYKSYIYPKAQELTEIKFLAVVSKIHIVKYGLGLFLKKFQGLVSGRKMP